MAKTVGFKTSAVEDERLPEMLEQLEQLKDNLAELIQDYDKDGADEDELDALTEVLDTLEDAWEGLSEVRGED